MTATIRVLVADDSQTDRLLLSSIVAREGHEVVTAVDGVDALEKFTACNPQLVLLDALMPGLDGFEVARRIKDLAREDFVPIIFLTSLTEADELARCLVAGGDDFLSKPYNTVILRAKIIALERMRQMHATLQLQRDEIALHHARLVREQEAAKSIFDSVAHSGCLDADNIRHLISPLAIFNGDVLLAARNPSGNMYVLLGDFTGHGLTASIGAMPLAEIFYGMTQKGFLIGDILRECNRKLNEILPVGYFCCATAVDFNFWKRTVEVWNGGLPDAYVLRGDGRLGAVRSRHLPLGVVGPARFDATVETYELEHGDRILMCTDGVVESRDEQGGMFGAERLSALLARTSAEHAFEVVREAVLSHAGESAREDDLTLVEIAMCDEQEVGAPASRNETSSALGPLDWSMTYELGPVSMRAFNPLPLLQHVLMEVPSLRSRGGEIFTVLSELYSNALDHGVLRLESTQKSSASGFAAFYADRGRALEHLDGGFVRFEITSRANERTGELRIRVIDSGVGFDHVAAREGGPSDPRRLHGRGMRLLDRLCDQVTYFGRGNDVEALFRWSRPS